MADIENKAQEQVANATATARQKQNAEPAAPQQPQARPCPKDCRRCSMQQQICCASLLSFQAFEVMGSIIQRLDIQSQRIADMETRLSSIQSSEEELAAPCVTQGDLFSETE